MEALSAAQDDSSGANPSSVKSDDSSPQRDSGAGSPPPNCAICLGTCKNKSFTDSCLHQFCFSCLLTWSKVKAECPLCKQTFRSIIHNVRSNHQYEEYLVVQRQTEESSSRIDIDHVTAATQRFRYRTTLTLPRRETYAIQELLRQYPFMADVFMSPIQPVARRRRSPASFRRTVYRHNLWARPLPDFTGRFRDCSPEFYRYNDTQMHRLVPWLNRELHYLLNENVGHISYVTTRILELLSQHHINSPEFREAMDRYFGDRTEHFLHELFCFASTPYDMTGYDRNVQYTTISSMVNEVVSSSESEVSADSDIVLVSSSHPNEDMPAGPSNRRGPPRTPSYAAWQGLAPRPSRRPPPVYPDTTIAYDTDVRPVIPMEAVVPIETISHSDTDDDDSEVMVVGYIKPPQERTPEIVDLLGSDSDVIVQETAAPEAEARAAPAVKLTLKRSHSGSSRDADTWRATPDRFPAWRPPSASSTTSSSPSPSPSPSSTDSDYSQVIVKKKSKKSSRKRSVSSRRDRRSKKRSSRSHHREKRVSAEKDKRAKRKSHSGKGVKSSKRSSDRTPESMEPVAGPSGTRASGAATSSGGISGACTNGACASGASSHTFYFGGVSSSGACASGASSNTSYLGGGSGSGACASAATGNSAYSSGASGNGTSGSGAGGEACGALRHTCPAYSEQRRRAKDRNGASGSGTAGSGSSGGEAGGALRHTCSTGIEQRRRAKERKRRRRDTRDSKRLRSVVNVMYHRHVEEPNSSANCSYSNVNSAEESDATAGRESSQERTKSSRSPAPSHSRNGDNDGSTDSEDNLPLNLTLHKMNMPT